MESDVYNQIHEQEARHWWNRGMIALCSDQVRRRMLDSISPTRRVILDVGCGTGLWTAGLLEFGRVIGADNARESLDICRERGLRDIVKCDAESLPIAPAGCDAVTALGVIEHLDDDRALLLEVERVLKPGSCALFLTSAYKFLWSEHDEAAHHKRRYTRRSLREMVERANLEVLKISYVNFFLFVPILLVRMLRSFGRAGRRGQAGSPDLFLPPAIFNNIFYALLRMESWMIRYINFPFGVSLLVIARKRSQSAAGGRKVVRNGILFGAGNDKAGTAPVGSMRSVWHLYRRESLATRFHVIGRMLVCPFPEVAAYFKQADRILDLGCGHGILLNLLALSSKDGADTMVGVDHDPHKIEIARRCSDPRIRFSSGPLADMPDSAFNAISIVDVLYAIDVRSWQETLSACFRLLKPGGMLIVKEIVNSPRWKYWCMKIEEKIAVEILKITKGEKPHFESIEYCRGALERSGFRVMDGKALAPRWWPINHYLFVAEKK